MKKVLALVALASLASGQLFAADNKATGFTPSRDIEWVVTSSPRSKSR